MHAAKLAFVLVRVLVPGRGPHLLLRWNSKFDDWSFIGGHVEGTESFHEAAIRETVEETPWIWPDDFYVRVSSCARLWWCHETADEIRRYHAHLFPLTLHEPDAAVQKALTDPKVFRLVHESNLHAHDVAPVVHEMTRRIRNPILSGQLTGLLVRPPG
jgi:8-oxo-dGTP pyrophosphatase MutT (NUDIX family)